MNNIRKCQHCMLSKRPATHHLTSEGGTWHYIRGGQVNICEVCVERKEQEWLRKYGAREKAMNRNPKPVTNKPVYCSVDNI